MPVVLATAAVGWAIATLGWVASPLTARLLNEGFALLGRKASALEVKQELVLAWLALLWEEHADQIPRLKKWATEFRSAFFDVEDTLDAAKYNALANKAKPPSGVKKKLHRLLSYRKASKLLSKLEKLQEMAKQGSQILESFKKSTMDHTVTASTTISRPHHTKVFGRDEERHKILQMLHKACSDSVIGIYGIAGSGKTTLAQYVCEYEENQSCIFSPVIWIDVSGLSGCFDVDKIYRQMLEAASEEQWHNLCNLETLRKKLDAKLRGKRFLMVLDGMRMAVEDKRDELLARLNTGNEGSKILVTTWSKDVAMSLGAKNPIKIQELNEKDFLDLFMHCAARDHSRMGEKERQKLEELGRGIAKRLERSPFAAKEVGGQLCKYSLNVKVPIVRELLCPETIRGLRKSFKYLDEPVRRCFAYCSMFPRMHPFKRDALIMMWMAQGFIEDNRLSKMENIGKDYFNQLVSWSLMQPGGNTAYNEDVWFIPDMLHELAEEVAGTDCLRVQGNELEKSDEEKASFLSTVRHLFITPSKAIKFESDIYKMKKLRTLYISSESDDGSFGITVQVLKRMLKELRKLRVVQVHLDAEKLKIPKCICDLKHLRFLGISVPIGTSDSEPLLKQVEMPKKFGKLYHLQNIDILPVI